MNATMRTRKPCSFTTLRTAFAGLAALVLGFAAEAQAVSLSFSQVEASAFDNVSLFDRHFTNAHPTDSVTASVPNYSSVTTGSYVIAGDSATFGGTFLESRGGTAFGGAEGEVDSIFAPTVTSSYDLSGVLTSLGGGLMTFNVFLQDQTTGVFLFQHFLSDVNGPGTQDTRTSVGNFNESYLGSPTGTLEPFHNYHWSAQAMIKAWTGGDAGGSAHGSASLIVAAAAPEPSTFVLGAFGILGLGIVARRKKFRRA